jgi:hypothetical protein
MMNFFRTKQQGEYLSRRKKSLSNTHSFLITLLTNIIMAIKVGRVRKLVHSSCLRKIIKTYHCCAKSEEKTALPRFACVCLDSIKTTLKKRIRVCELVSNGSEEGPFAGCGENSKGPLGPFLKLAAIPVK